MGALAYTPEQRTKALTRLALEHGNAEKVADMLIDDEFQVPADTLRHWMLVAHSEQYKRIELELSQGNEREAVATLQSTIRRTAELKLDMIEAVGEIKNPQILPQALRALADAEAKGVSELLALTGRPTDGKSDGQASEMRRLVQSMMDRGLIKPAAGFEPAIEGSVEDS